MDFFDENVEWFWYISFEIVFVFDDVFVYFGMFGNVVWFYG